MTKIKAELDEYIYNHSEPTNINEISSMIGELREAIQKEFFEAGWKSRDAEIEKLQWLNKNITLGRDAARNEVNEQQAEIKKLKTLLDAVKTSDYTGIKCYDIDGKNWFNAREEALKPSEIERREE